jgi:hypothetical protein
MRGNEWRGIECRANKVLKGLGRYRVHQLQATSKSREVHHVKRGRDAPDGSPERSVRAQPYVSPYSGKGKECVTGADDSSASAPLNALSALALEPRPHVQVDDAHADGPTTDPDSRRHMLRSSRMTVKARARATMKIGQNLSSPNSSCVEPEGQEG